MLPTVWYFWDNFIDNGNVHPACSYIAAENHTMTKQAALPISTRSRWRYKTENSDETEMQGWLVLHYFDTLWPRLVHLRFLNFSLSWRKRLYWYIAMHLYIFFEPHLVVILHWYLWLSNYCIYLLDPIARSYLICNMYRSTTRGSLSEVRTTCTLLFVSPIFLLLRFFYHVLDPTCSALSK